MIREARWRPIAGMLAAVVAAATAVRPVASQDPQPPPPTFRAAIDLVPVDVNIVDRTGRPVLGLTAGDFALTVDNEPRRIASAEYVKTGAGAPAAAPAPEHYSSNAVAGGRMIMLVVDQASIGAGRARQVTEAAGRFIRSLTPADRIGLTSLPAGPQIDFTRNHALVRDVLPSVIGRASAVESLFRIGLSEAADIQRGSRLALDQAVQRECSGATGAADLEICSRQVMADAINIYASARDRGRTTLTGLRQLVDRLSATLVPKTVVFVSEGLYLDREFGDLAWLGPAAAKGQMVFYVLQIERPLVDASRSRETSTGSQDRYLDQDGLSLIANLTRGAVLRVVGGADQAFRRLALETSGYYLLTFEPGPRDGDGRPHRIRVQVPGRADVEIRARSEFVIGAHAARTDEDILTETLRAPLPATDIGLKLATYMLGAPAGDRLLVLFAAEIERGRDPSSALALAYVLVDGKGTVVTGRFVRDLEGPVSADGRTLRYVGSIPAPEGIHMLKVAVLDSRGRRGSVERTFRAQLTPVGRLRTSDLVLAPGRAPGIANSTGSILPTITADFTTDELHGYLELYSESPDALNRASVAVEVAGRDDSRLIDSAPARIRQSGDNPGRRTAEAVVPLALLPPGDYVARAVVTLDGTRAGEVSRPFRVSRGAPVGATAPGTPSGDAPAARASIALPARTEAFDRQSVLAPGLSEYSSR